ncbi:protein-disulfide isomerase [Shewanella canadensis]|uniref:Protein-disulfide isomerase n=1 Tax=Shewanella canadensis TaxID=271096 RepID=A0A3S0RW42_9GAMM|nr:protein-disulfide isomerase [Shewanella canadensis]RTR37616.1 protein-disulfide isomerase [Shewanella canadensis]
MTSDLYFIYDSHCPWSYAATPVVNALSEAYPEMNIHLLHCTHFNGSDSAGQEQVDAVLKLSAVKFGREHIRYVNSPKNAIKTANLMAWMQNKQPDKMLPVLNALQKAHFIEGNPLNSKHDFTHILEQFKLSPSNKVFRDELSSDAEYVLEDISEIQEMIGTMAFPVLLLSTEDKGVFIDHSLYLGQPQDVVEAVKQELS